MKRSILLNQRIIDGGNGGVTILASNSEKTAMPAEGRQAMGRPTPTNVEPPKEILDKTFSMDNAPALDTDSDLHGEVTAVSTPVVKTEEKPKTNEVKKVEETKKDEPKTTPDEKPKPKSLLDSLKDPKKKTDTRPNPQADLAKRDLSVFDVEEVEAAKQMSNAAFEQFRKLKVASKQNVDAQFYQSPEAYVTHPAYKELQIISSLAHKESRFWAEQLELVKSGKPAHQLKEWNTRTGEPILGEEIPANNTTEEMIRSNVYKINNIAEQKYQELSQFGKKYEQVINSDAQAISQERANRFAWVANPEIMEHTLDIPGVGERSVKQIRDDFKAFFPSYLRTGPMAEVCADLFVALQLQGIQLKQATDSSTVNKIIENEKKDVEPTSNNKPKDITKGFGGITEFSTANMPVGM